MIMNAFKLVLSLFLMSFLLNSCAVKQAFTKDIIDRYDLTDKTMKQVQFYTSQYIVLESSSVSEAQHVDGGRLVVSQNNKNFRIIIQPNTKCVFEKSDADGNIYIRFEQGNNNFLKFMVRKNDRTGKYYLAADYSDGQKGKVSYNGKTYYINSASGNAFLMVSIKKLNQSYGKNKYVKGMKVR